MTNRVFMSDDERLSMGAKAKACAPFVFTRRLGLRFLTAFATVNLLLAYIVCFNYMRSVPWPQDVLAQIYLVTMYIGYIGVIVFGLGWFLPALILMICPHRSVLFFISILLMTFFFLYIAIDMVVVNSFHFHFNGFFMSMLFSKAASDIFQFGKMEWLLFILSVIAIVVVQIALAYWMWRRYIVPGHGRLWRARWHALALGFVFMGWAISHGINAWGYATFIPSVMSRSHVFPLYYGLTAHSFLTKHHLIDPKKITQKHNEAYVVHHAALSLPLHPLRIEAASQRRPYNIIFLLIDTWRADAMNAQVSPSIAAFANRNLQFTNHWSGGDCTRPGIFSLFYSIPASYWQSELDSRQAPVFMDTLQRLGYHFSIHGSADLSVPPFNATVFSHIKPLQIVTPGDSSWQRDQRVTRYMTRAIVSQAMMEKKQKHPHPLFAYAFYDAVHAYTYPPGFKLKFHPSWSSVNHLALSNHFNPEPFFNLYKNAVLFDDGLVGKVLQTLKDQHLLDHTIVVISSDHGNEFNDNHKGYWGHASNFSPAQMHVPMIVHWPGKAAHHYNQYTSHFDVVPTIMSGVLGVQNPYSDYSFGKNIFTNKSWPFLVVSSYQALGVVERHRLTTFYRGGYFKQTTPALDPIKTKINPGVMRRVFMQMQRFFKTIIGLICFPMLKYGASVA